jgi:cupin fold WbuC family metalloprotein
MKVTVFSNAYFEELVGKAGASPRRRQHRNVHADYADPCQRLFNAIEPDSYLQPHRHSMEQGAETMVAVRGQFALLTFDDFGRIDELQTFGSGSHGTGESGASGIEIPPMHWHTLLALKSGSVLLEIKAGPFDPDRPKLLARWAPAEGSEEAHLYHQSLMDEIRRRL